MPRTHRPSPSRPPRGAGHLFSRLRARGARPALRLVVFLALSQAATSGPALAGVSSNAPAPGAYGMLVPHSGSLLVEYYEGFLRDQDIDTFRDRVLSRYTESTLARLLDSPDIKARRAAVLALGLVAGFGSNAAVARGLRDRDPIVRELADNALWAIWFRADTPDNNAMLRRVRERIGRNELAEAVDLATRLIERAPNFAEAYNQRAIAHFFQGHFAQSADDCRRVLERNPFHTGALAGLARCQLQLDRRAEAIQTFRRAMKLQPYNEALRQAVEALEARGE